MSGVANDNWLGTPHQHAGLAYNNFLLQIRVSKKVKIKFKIATDLYVPHRHDDLAYYNFLLLIRVGK